MLSLLLSVLIALVQVLACAGPGCEFPPATQHRSGAHSGDHRAPQPLGDALASMGQAAIEAAFSGVVRVGGRPAAGDPWRTGDC